MLSTAAPAAGLSLTLSSSNTAVATVPASVAVAPGATTATFTITAVAPGTATITATSGAGATSSTFTVTARAVLASITLSSSTVIGGNSVQGTAVLTGAAPVGGAAVTFAGADPVIVPVNVVVPAGATSTTFSIETRAVGGTIPATITASYGGASMSVVLSVTKTTAAVASFGVTGPQETETCTLTNSGATLNCTFNGSTSVAPGNIIGYDWAYVAGATTFQQTTTGAVLTQPTVDCTFVPAPTLPAGGNQALTLTVSLRVRDDLGNVSAVVTDRGARLFPQGSCGY